MLVLERRKLENIFPEPKPHENRLYNPVGLPGVKFSILVEFRFLLILMVGIWVAYRRHIGLSFMFHLCFIYVWSMFGFLRVRGVGIGECSPLPFSAACRFWVFVGC